MLTADGNQINMALAVQKVTEKYHQLWSSHKGFSNHVEIMEKHLQHIKTHQQHTEEGSAGVTLNKDNAADQAIELGLNLAGSAFVYAKKMKNEKLKAQFHILKKDLTNVQEILAVSRLKDLLQHLTTIEADVADYVSKEEIQALDEAVTAFESQVANPRAFIAERAKSNEIVAAAVMELKDNFKDMDKLITKFKQTEFERAYNHARIVIDHGKGGPGKGDNGEPKAEGPKDTDPML